jgi:hypothetical protein
MSEPDFIIFKNQFAGNTIEEKVKKVPPVELALADNSIYAGKERSTASKDNSIKQPELSASGYFP